MKLSLAITLASTLSGAAAFGIRGAAERAYYFSAYVLEEAFDNPDDFRIAKGCVGTRLGLGGQAGRCTLKEFCEHLWAPTPPVNEPRPDVTVTQWDGDSKNTGRLKGWKIEAVMKWIQNVYIINADGKKQALKPGYTGALEVSNLLEGETDYYEAAGKFGTYAWRARQRFQETLGSLPDTDANKIKFAEWDNLVQVGAQNALDWRLSDATQTKANTIKNRLKAKYGKSNVVSIQYTTEPATIAGNTPKVVDIHATAVETAKGSGWPSDSVLESDINNIISYAESTQAGKDHAVAIEAARKSNKFTAEGCE